MKMSKRQRRQMKAVLDGYVQRANTANHDYAMVRIRLEGQDDKIEERTRAIAMIHYWTNVCKSMGHVLSRSGVGPRTRRALWCGSATRVVMLGLIVDCLKSLIREQEAKGGVHAYYDELLVALKDGLKFFEGELHFLQDNIDSKPSALAAA